MFEQQSKKKKREDKIIKKLERLNYIFSKNSIIELNYLLDNGKKYIFRYFIAGIFRGVGAGIGFTIFTAILIIILQKIVTLNIPIIGDYIADIVSIVEKKI